MAKVLAPAASDDKKNALLWETNRSVDGQGRPVNGSGTAILLNDIHTSDGGDFDGDGQDDNTYGIRTDLAVDVYPTRVIRTVDGVKRVEHPLGFAVQTAVYGAVLQNVDIRANLTATPIPGRPSGIRKG